jgi:tRNA(Ile2) C34 agmatinyltransferase TiaS
MMRNKISCKGEWYMYCEECNRKLESKRTNPPFLCKECRNLKKQESFCGITSESLRRILDGLE